MLSLSFRFVSKKLGIRLVNRFGCKVSPFEFMFDSSPLILFLDLSDRHQGLIED